MKCNSCCTLQISITCNILSTILLTYSHVCTSSVYLERRIFLKPFIYFSLCTVPCKDEFRDWNLILLSVIFLATLVLKGQQREMVYSLIPTHSGWSSRIYKFFGLGHLLSEKLIIFSHKAPTETAHSVTQRRRRRRLVHVKSQERQKNNQWSCSSYNSK